MGTNFFLPFLRRNTDRSSQARIKSAAEQHDLSAYIR